MEHRCGDPLARFFRDTWRGFARTRRRRERPICTSWRTGSGVESLPDMLVKSRVQFPELAELWDAYVQEASARGRGERLAAIVESACAALMRGVADPTAAF